MLIDCHVHLHDYHEGRGRPTRENVLSLFEGPYVKFFENLDLPAEKKENIAWRTTARLFKIPLPTPAP